MFVDISDECHVSKRKRVEQMASRCEEVMLTGYRVAVDLSLEDLLYRRVRTVWSFIFLYVILFVTARTFTVP